jgi:hypothetical protein
LTCVCKDYNTYCSIGILTFPQNHHALKSIPYNGKKLKPAKLRKDYWYPMAQIDFGEGKGHIGRSVYQKLRELKHLHEVAWPDEVLYKHPDEYTQPEKEKVAEKAKQGIEYRPTRNVRQRGIALNAQKANAIADMAVALAGQGRGNKISQPAEDGNAKLLDVTVQWANEQDHNFAESWSENVLHRTFAGDELVIAPVTPATTEQTPAESSSEGIASTPVSA